MDFMTPVVSSRTLGADVYREAGLGDDLWRRGALRRKLEASRAFNKERAAPRGRHLDITDCNDAKFVPVSSGTKG